MRLRTLILLLSVILLLFGLGSELVLRGSQREVEIFLWILLAAMTACYFYLTRMWKKLGKREKTVILISGIYALVGGLVGNAAFVPLEWIFWTEPATTLHLSFFAVLLLAASAITCVPAFVGGVCLGLIVISDVNNGKFSIENTIIKAVAVGVFTGISLCIIVALLLDGGGNLEWYLRRTFEVALISSLAAEWVGWRLARRVSSLLLANDGEA